MKVGFIRLGIMGWPMAGHIIKGGHELFLHSRRRGLSGLAVAGVVRAVHSSSSADAER
jgi:2-hydroxy-3-oxopropionate reductase